jgi:hypothetical protein
MDRIKRKICWLVVCFLIISFANAHPHSNVDQQVSLSIGIDKIAIKVFIVPSYIEGSAIFNVLDSNGDCIISKEERMRFGNNVLRRTKLLVNKRFHVFKDPIVSIPNYDQMVSGLGTIIIESSIQGNLAIYNKHELSLNMDFDEFSHDWFIQPFLYQNFNDNFSVNSLNRTKKNSRLIMHFIPKVINENNWIK